MSDQIEKTTILRATRDRVWDAISDAEEFGEWFGIEFNGPFTPGTKLEGRVTLRGYEQVRAQVIVDRVEPEMLLSLYWHPAPVDPRKDYSGEPMTCVTFLLADVPGGTRLTITESGFDQLPAGRREEAFQMNEKGWDMQLDSITQYVSRAA
jgi:uncharacterized protein YndB with AHSA1/START domain